MGGITPLLQTLRELEKRGVKGEILTTNYLNFSEPRALEKLNKLSNITLKMYDVESSGDGFHTKGYIFRKDEIYNNCYPIHAFSSNLKFTYIIELFIAFFLASKFVICFSISPFKINNCLSIFSNSILNSLLVIVLASKIIIFSRKALFSLE